MLLLLEFFSSLEQESLQDSRLRCGLQSPYLDDSVCLVCKILVCLLRSRSQVFLSEYCEWLELSQVVLLPCVQAQAVCAKMLEMILLARLFGHCCWRELENELRKGLIVRLIESLSMSLKCRVFFIKKPPRCEGFEDLLFLLGGDLIQESLCFGNYIFNREPKLL